MSPDEAISKLRQMQSQIIHGSNIFGEIADLLFEAKYLIQKIGTTDVEYMDIIDRADRWEKGLLRK